jgi:transposase InsO family protein
MPNPNLQKKGECLVKIVGRYAMPEEVLSDNGPQFTSKVIQSMMTAMDVNHVFSTPYHHQGNGHVKRCNREVIKHLRNIVFDEEVVKIYSRVQYILNSSPHSATGYSPIQLLFGNSITVNRATPNHAFTPDEPGMTIDYYQQKCIRV